MVRDHLAASYAKAAIMSELQSDDSGITFNEPEVQEHPTEQKAEPEVTEKADLAPDSPKEGEENTEDSQEKTPEWFQKKINKQTFAQRQAERERDELKTRLEELEKKSRPTLEDVSIPAIPDSWDENYESKIRERDKAISQKAQVDAARLQREESQALQQQQAQRQELERAQSLQSQFSENGKKLGVSQQSLLDAQNAVVDYGVTPDLANALLEDDQGPLMVQYLAANPLDLHDIVNSSPVQAGLRLAEVKAKAAALKPKPSSAPDPATALSGRAVPTKERGPEGATYK